MEKLIKNINQANSIEDLNFEEIHAALSSEDSLLRCDTIEALSKFIDNDTVLNSILKMLDDEDILVRCEVYEAIGYVHSDFVLGFLFNHLSIEKEDVGRMYILSSINNIVQHIGVNKDFLTPLKNMYAKEQSKNVIISYLCVFYTVEKNINYVKNILEYINDDDYHIRCVVINSLSEIVDDTILNLVQSELKKRLLIETSKAVKELLTQFIGIT